MGICSFAGCKADTDEDKQDNTQENTSDISGQTQNGSEEETDEVTKEKIKITFDENTTYQTIESFGASGAWWSQDVGGWMDGETDDGTEPREKIATLLFDRENGIGLTAYRYNIGAGTADAQEYYSGITDKWRRAESFLDENGNYDWTKDENAVWFLKRATELGAEEIVFFCNSPIVSLTKNNKGCGDETQNGTTSNLDPQNYRAFAEYVLDVVEHFKNEGYPIKYISPVNEPQWEWTSGQEGCHYEPEELVEFLNVFLDVMDERGIEDLELSAPELGEWGNTSYKYYNAIFSDERLKSRLKSLDVHSYWTDEAAKTSFMKYLDTNGLSGLELKMSEWCEMTNGKDTGMSSALELANTVQTDLTTLNVTSWQYWIAVSCYDYRDGLVYVFTGNHAIVETKRLWALGNFSRFIRPGYVRIDSSIEISQDNGTSDSSTSDSSTSDNGTSDNGTSGSTSVSNYAITSSAYIGTDEDGSENIVIVIVNNEDTEFEIATSDFEEYTSVETYVTDTEHSLEKISDETQENIEIPSKSVATLLIKK
jgi:O-glycosyl hydrolase